MVAKTPIRATLNGSEVTGLAEYQSGEFIDLSHGGLGASLSIGTTGQVLKVNSGGTALEFGNVEAVINIDTANDLTGSTLVSSDQILLSDGGTEGRVTLSQLDTLFSGTTQTLTNKTIDSASNTITLDLSEGTFTGTLSEFNSALSDGSFASLAGTETLTNKTLTSPIISTISNTGTLTLPTSTDTLVGRATTDTLTNKTIDVDNNTVSNIEVDNFKASSIVLESEGIGSNDNDTSLPTSAAVKDYVDSQVTAQDLDFQADTGGTLSIDLDSETLTFTGGTGIDTSGSGNAVTFAIDSTVATLTGTQTLTNKTLTTPTISSIVNTGTLTLPTSTDTLVGRTTTDTLTNKTINLSSNTLTGTTAQFNTALSDGSFATLAGTETLTNKTLTSPVIAEITSGADIDLSATNDVNIPANVGLTFGDDGEKIEGDGTNLTISASNAFSINATNSIFLTSAQSTQFRKGSTNYLTISDSSSDAVITSAVQDKDIIFKGNDGGSTITALTLDMSEAGNATFNNNVTVGNDLTVTGNLIVSGTTTTVNTETINLADNTITLNSNETGTPSQDGGIEIERGTSTNKTLIWNETTDKWTVGSETFVAGTFEGALTGDVTGNADTATALETARTIGGVSFDGTANIDLPGVNTTGNQDTSGNAATATALETARTIAGQSFDGTADITIASTDLSDTSNVTLNNATQTLTNKTLTSPIISSPTITGDATFDTNTLHVDSTNNRIGIGTTSPGVGLDFQMINSEEGFRVRRHNASGQYIDISETDGSRHEIKGIGTKEFRMVNDTTDSGQGWHFYRNGSERFRILGDGLITLPSGAATLVGDTTTQTLTNKTIDASSNTISNIGNSQLISGIDAAKISSGSVSNTEFDYLDGVTSSIQTQLDDKASKGFAIAMAIAL